MTLMYRAAAGSVDITPAEPLPLGGFASRRGSFDGIADPLEVNALIVDDGRTRVALVSADLLFTGSDLRERILAGLRSPLNPDHLLLAASHTHYAPMTLHGMPKLGPVDESYANMVVARVTALLNQLVAEIRPVVFHYGETIADHGVNRRLPRLAIGSSGIRRTVRMCFNRSGPRDETVRLMRVVGEDGHDVAVAWNYACHPTGAPRPTHVSADYPGRVRHQLRNHLGVDTPVLFFQGFSGDIRPPFSGRISGPAALARRVYLGPQFGTPTLETWNRWTRSLADCVLNAHANAIKPVGRGGVRAVRTRAILDACIAGGRTCRAMAIQSIALGLDFVWVAIEAEVVVSYRRLIETIVPFHHIFTVGCVDQPIGYLPTDAMILEGGYEADQFRDGFAFDGRYVPGIELIVKTALNLNQASW